jgi:Bax protein
MSNFERAALAAVGTLIAGLVAAVVYFPPALVTSVPRAVLDFPAAQPEPSEMVTSSGVRALRVGMSEPTAHKLSSTFSELGYDLEAVLAGESRVPRLFLASLPADMAKVREVKVRKAIFFQTVLPLILQVNEEILAERRHLWQLRFRRSLGLRLDAIDRLRLAALADRHGVERGDIDALLLHIDIIPPSLALAQAAEESGWGTSRFVREGNALFGQWTFSNNGQLVPGRRDAGKKHGIKAFDSLLDSVRAYSRNLNSHRAYRGLRALRAAMRRAGVPIDGATLTRTLLRYSQRGPAYVASIRSIIAVNKLRALDDARLHEAIAAVPAI